MIYTVFIDGINVYDVGDPDLILIEPNYENELNSAGSFTFKMGANHSYYDLPRPLLSDVEIRERDEVVWFGRVIGVELDWLNQKTVTCEGALAYFNDSIQRPKIYDTDEDHSIKTFFRDLIDNHNEQVPNNRKFVVGNVTIDEKFVYRKLNYETTIDCLASMCLNAEGGYLVVRKENGLNYIDWVREVPYVADQPLQYAINITDVESQMSYTDFATAIVPLGEEDEFGYKTTCADENDGKDYIESYELVKTYGRITKVVEFNGLSKAIDLKEAGEKYLTDNQFDPLTITVSAAELAYLNDDYTAFKVGQMVQVTSFPHGIEKRLPILKIGGDLDSASKTIECGTVKKRTLTEIYKEE